jgi:hypothetical protein
MPSRFGCGLAALMFAVTPVAAGPEPDPLARLRADVGFLAADRLEGRDTASRGFEIAALYAASRLAEAGLRPAVAGGFEQRVRFASATRASSSIVLRGPGSARRLEWKVDYLVSPSAAHATVDLTAPVVFAGYGVEAPELGHDDYADIDARGKLVLIFGGAPASFPIDERAHYSASRTKAEAAARHGAVGMLQLASRADDRRVPWSRRVLHADRPTLRWKGVDGALADAFPELRFTVALSPLGARKLLEATGVELEALLDAEERGEVQPRALPVSLTVRAQNDVVEVTSPNVVALLPGSDPALAGEAIVLTAHLDHLGLGAAVDGDSVYNGFWDNAMGSAIVLETARRLAESPSPPRRPVLVALVTGEEKGLLGSDFLAANPPLPIVADVNVDMPLLRTPLAELLAYGAEHSSLGAPAAAAAAAHGFRLGRDPFPEEVIFVRSDQYPFVRHGVPAIFLDAGYATLAGDDAQRRAAAEFERLHYHRPSDDARLAPDWETVARFTAAVVDLVRAVADAPARPTWNPGDFFGERFGQRTPDRVP